VSISWCRLCGSSHPRDARCPGIEVPTGPEFAAWRVSVETPRGIQGYAVLLAPAGNQWRARILTFPNVMWTIPGGGCSMKFVGRTADEAEAPAVAFIRRHCAERSYLMRDELEPLPDGVLARGPAHGVDAIVLDPRFERALPVRFGLNRPSVVGSTGNMSRAGLFVATQRPLVEGAFAGMLLELEHCKVPLRGSVIWQRLLRQPGRDPGMGLELLDPPRIYLRYVDALAA
jgi:hypothetical protein